MITVLFFGPVAEHAGVSSVQVEFSEQLTLANLRQQLARRFPEAFDLVSLAAVDGCHERDENRWLNDGAEVVFMSKFSGG